MPAKEMTCELCTGRKFKTSDRDEMRRHLVTDHKKTRDEIRKNTNL
jgi:hypothetical protein